MKWSRGLFRLWIVAAALWAALVVIFGWEEATQPYYPGHAITVGNNKETVFKRFSGEDIDLRRMKDNGELKAYEVQGVEGTSIYMLADLSEAEVAARMERAAPLAIKLRDDTIQEGRRKGILVAVAFATIPSVVVLILGGALLWALRGFRQI